MGEDKTAFIGKPAKEHTYSTYIRTYIHTHTRTALPHLYKTKLHLCVCIFFYTCHHFGFLFVHVVFHRIMALFSYKNQSGSRWILRVCLLFFFFFSR